VCQKKRGGGVICGVRACGACVIAYGGPRDADAVAKQLVLRGVEPLICARADCTG
jgi:hypothetical protein